MEKLKISKELHNFYEKELENLGSPDYLLEYPFLIS